MAFICWRRAAARSCSLLILSLLTLSPALAADPTKPTVVLLHGLARSAHSMTAMANALEKAGFATCNIGYPSTGHSIETLAADHVLPAIRQCDPAPATALYFVTHSMGGIVVRQLRASQPELAIGRVVMLGPPNHGSEVVDNLGDWWAFRWLNGPAGQQLSTAAEALPNRLGPAQFELGVIAGNKPFLEPFTGYFDGPSDGKVSTASARLAGMADFLVLPVTHSLMMRDDAAIRQTIHFLRHGRFRQSSTTAQQ